MNHPSGRGKRPETDRHCDPRKYMGNEWIVFDMVFDFNKYIAGVSLVISHYGKTTLNAALRR
ncbi:MAG: hypothetical protein QXP97_05585 [Desulfurococcus sp.]|uniref:hypothetical protein n=1 Tax=Desulfurococcus sp. TaxID=51678 RepID=UPI0031640DA7